MIQEFASRVLAQIQEDVDNYSRDLARGACGDFADYKGLCGRVQGLQQAQQTILDLAKRAQNHDDDEHP